MKLYVERIRLNRGGYDRRGRYYGVGQPLYHVTGENTGTEHTSRRLVIDELVRAPDARAARQKVAAKFDVQPADKRQRASSRAALAKAKSAAEHAERMLKKTREESFARIISGKYESGPAHYNLLAKDHAAAGEALLVSADAYREAGNPTNLAKAERQEKRAEKEFDSARYWRREAEAVRFAKEIRESSRDRKYRRR